jgi:hypothetical protein
LNKRTCFLYGVIGLCAAVLVGIGEALLHYSDVWMQGEAYAFMRFIPRSHLVWGHFIATLSAPFYLFGYWHVYQMLNPSKSEGVLKKGICFVAAYGFIMGACWIASRAMIGSVVQQAPSEIVQALIGSYQFFMDSLLKVIQLTTFLFSAVFIYLVLRGKTFYPKWAAVFSPILWVGVCFLIFSVMPDVGRYLMPIAMNVAHVLFFSLSLFVARKL